MSAKADPTPPRVRDLPVEGMHCAGCVQSVETLLRRTDGVEEASANFGTHRIHVEGDVALKTLEERLSKGGYRLGDRTTRLPAGVDAEAAGALDGVLEVAPEEGGLRVRHVDDPGVLEALRALLPEHAQLQTEEDPRTRRLVAMERRWRLRFLLAAPLAALAMIAAMTAWLPEPLRGGWVQLVLAAVVVFGAGAPILAGAFAALRRGSADMDVLIALGTLVAFGASTAVVLGLLDGPLYFDASAMIMAFVSLGRWLEARARQATGSAVDHLLRLEPETALVLAGPGAEARSVPLRRVLVGDRVLVKPGARVPVDGVVRDGASRLDESLLTGESLPVARGEGDEVAAGTTNGTGALEIEVTAVGDDTTLRRIAAWVERAQGQPAPVARVADRVAAVFVPVVLGLAALTFLGWWLVAGDSDGGVSAAIAVLVIACPCALGLATPVAIVVGTGRAARQGILIEGGAAIERAARVRTVVFDKTGTLTEGEVRVETHELDASTLAMVAAVERKSEHPLAGAILQHAARVGVEPRASTAFEASSGRGVQGMVEGRSVHVGSAAWFDELGIGHGALDAWRAAAGAAGATVVLVALDSQLAGGIAIAQTQRPDAREAVDALRAQDIDVRILSGDTPEAVAQAARELGIPVDATQAAVRPEEKAEAIRAIPHAAMVGDGINDAPALASADVGIAVGGATDVAGAAAAIGLLGDSLHGVPIALALCRRTLRTIHENLAWAFGYNALAIPLAALGILPPMAAAGAMALSSVSVVLNSLRLRRAPLGPGTFSDD